MTETDMWYVIAMLFFIVVDYLTGIIKAIIQRNLSSQKMRTGLGHKLAYLILATTAWFTDTINGHIPFGFPASLFICTSTGISLIEITSILENITAINPELKTAPFMHIFEQNKPKHKEG